MTGTEDEPNYRGGNYRPTTLDDVLDLLQGRSAPSKTNRVLRSLRRPDPALKSWLAAVCEHGAGIWKPHHSPDWDELTKLLQAFHDDGKITDAQFGALVDLHPLHRGSEHGLPYDLGDEESAELAIDAVRLLREMLPGEQNRIDQMISDSFAMRGRLYNIARPPHGRSR